MATADQTDQNEEALHQIMVEFGFVPEDGAQSSRRASENPGNAVDNAIVVPESPSMAVRNRTRSSWASTIERTLSRRYSSLQPFGSSDLSGGHETLPFEISEPRSFVMEPPSRRPSDTESWDLRPEHSTLALEDLFPDDAVSLPLRENSSTVQQASGGEDDDDLYTVTPPAQSEAVGNEGRDEEEETLRRSQRLRDRRSNG